MGFHTRMFIGYGRSSWRRLHFLNGPQTRNSGTRDFSDFVPTRIRAKWYSNRRAQILQPTGTTIGLGALPTVKHHLAYTLSGSDVVSSRIYPSPGGVYLLKREFENAQRGNEHDLIYRCGLCAKFFPSEAQLER